MQVSTLTVHLGLGPKLVGWYRDAQFVPYQQLLTDSSPRTDHHLRYRRDSASIVSKFYIPERLKHLKSLDDEHTKSL